MRSVAARLEVQQCELTLDISIVDAPAGQLGQSRQSAPATGKTKPGRALGGGCHQVRIGVVF